MIGLFIFLTVLFGFLLIIYFTQSHSRGKRIEALCSEAGIVNGKLDAAREEMKKVKEESSAAKQELNDLRIKFKAIKKDAFDAGDNITSARERALEAERAEHKALNEVARIRAEMAALSDETIKQNKVIESLKAESLKLQEKIREVEKKPRTIPPPDNSIAEKARQMVAGLQERIVKMEKRLKQDRDDALERARQNERYRRQLEAVNTAYEVLRGQYNVLHDKLLHSMGMEGVADDRDEILTIDQAGDEGKPPAPPAAAAEPKPEEPKVPDTGSGPDNPK